MGVSLTLNGPNVSPRFRNRRVAAVAVAFLFIFLGNALLAQNLNEPAPRFHCKTLRGKSVTLRQYRGKVVLLDFWASWCPPCRKELPFLIRFYQEKSDSNFVILAVNIDDRAETMHRFLKQLHMNVPFPIIIDRQKEIPVLYDLQTMPSTFFIDKNGILRYRHLGFKNKLKAEFRRELSALLNEK